ncbi:cytochrome P450 1A5-like [Liolophura sinensis]|uniref:cytochrome P450 1A5-like n=1 Tax=Liolophura sinensis TaxID=3198878 RepID=UPI0031598DA1
MELITWVLLGLTLIFSGLFLINQLVLGQRLPPGPRGLPLIGCPWALFSEFHFFFTKMAKTWGDVVTINIMGKTVVVLNSAEVAREAFSSPSLADGFAGRPPAPTINEHIALMTGFLQPGSVLFKRRKILHKILKHYGEGLLETERLVQDELTHVIQWLENAGESVNLNDILYPSLINILTILLKGKRYNYDSPILANVRVLDETTTQAGSPAITLLFYFFPLFKRLNFGPGRLAQQNQRAAHQFNCDYFEESKATYSPGITRGMIDSLLHHQEESRSETGSSWLTDAHIKGVIHEMIAAGVLTTGSALYSFFLISVHNPEVELSILKEIDAVIGRKRFPRLEDRPNMPYTNSAILELLRYISHLPVGLAHQTTDNISLLDYVIPKDTMVFCNTWHFHHDDKIWDDPWEFKPERFLDEDGKLASADHPLRRNLMPFGIGKRSCVGETFAKSRLFLFITTLLQRFHFTRDSSTTYRSCDPRSYRPGIVVFPHKYWVKVTPRAEEAT